MPITDTLVIHGARVASKVFEPPNTNLLTTFMLFSNSPSLPPFLGQVITEVVLWFDSQILGNHIHVRYSCEIFSSIFYTSPFSAILQFIHSSASDCKNIYAYRVFFSCGFSTSFSPHVVFGDPCDKTKKNETKNLFK